MSTSAIDRQRTMALNGGRNAPIRASLRVKNSLNQLKAVAGTVRILDAPDVENNVETNITDGQVLVWNRPGGVATGRFTNATLTAVAPGLATVPRVHEVFVKGTAVSNAGDGRSTNEAVKDFEAGIALMSNFSNSYESMQFWVSGDVNFNTDSYNGRIREGSVVGNIRRGINIRGLLSSKTYTELPDASSPRNEGSNLVIGTVHPNTVFTVDNNLSDLPNGLNAWDTNIPIDSSVSFIRDSSDNVYPIAIDETNIDGITPNQRIFFATSDTSPASTQVVTELDFPCTITCNNNGDTTNPGFSMDGYVQFVEVHFKLQNGVVTPIHINGEFQALYSKFSNDTNGGTDATLELSANGWGDDPSAVAEIDPPNVTKAGTKNVRISHCIFQDLNIKVSSPCQFSDCVFTRCKFSNTIGASFINCTFYDTLDCMLGDSGDTYSYNNNLSINKSYVMYTHSGALFTVNSNAHVSVKNSIIRPIRTSGAFKAEALIVVEDNGGCTVDNINIPANSGVNTTLDTQGLAAVVVRCNGGSANVSNLSVVGSSTGCSLISGTNANIRLGSIGSTTTGTGPIITAFCSTVNIDSFDSTLNIGLANVSTTSGLFHFAGSAVSVGSSFNCVIDPISTNANVFYLVNSTMRNNITNDASSNYFNVSNNLSSHLFDLTTSEVVIETGRPALDFGGPQNALYGRHLLNDCSTLTINGTSSDLFRQTPLLSSTGSGDPTLVLNNSSSVNLININLNHLLYDPTYVSRIATLTNNCSLFVKSLEINVSGFTNESSLDVQNGSSVKMVDASIIINDSTNKSAINVSDNSNLIINNDPTESWTLTTNNNEAVCTCSNNSVISLNDMRVNSTGPKGFVVDTGSKINIHATVGLPGSLNISGTTSTADSVIHLTNDSSCAVTYMQFAVGVLTGSAIIADSMSRVYLKNVTAGANLPTESITIRNQSKMHMQGTNTIANTIKFGLNTPGTVTYATLVSNKLIPGADLITDGTGLVWTNSEGCVLTYST